jgi:putative inorganic carbon (HCO3(-)) transporter
MKKEVSCACINKNFLSKAKHYIFYVFILFLPISKAVVEIGFILLFLFYIAEKIILKKGNFWAYFPKSNLNWPIASLFLVLLLTVLHSVAPEQSWRGFFGKWFQFIMTYFIVLDIVDSEKKLKNVFCLFSVSLSVILVNAVWQFVFGSDFLYHRGLEQGIFIRGHFGSLNHFGSFLVFISPIVIFSLFHYFSDKLIARLYTLILAVTAASCLLFSFSAESWIAILVSYSSGLFILKDKQLIKRFFVFILFLIAVITLTPSYRQRVAFLIPQQVYGKGGRVDIWKSALKEIEKNPILGKGINTTRSSIMRRYSDLPILYEQSHLHSLYLQIFLEAGILGLLVYLWLLWRLFLMLVAFKKDILGFGLFTSILAFLLVNTTDTIWDDRISSLFWVIMALVVIYSRYWAEAKTQKFMQN